MYDVNPKTKNYELFREFNPQVASTLSPLQREYISCFLVNLGQRFEAFREEFAKSNGRKTLKQILGWIVFLLLPYTFGLEDDACERCRSRCDEALEVLLIKAPSANVQAQGVGRQTDKSKRRGRHEEPREACKTPV